MPPNAPSLRFALSSPLNPPFSFRRNPLHLRPTLSFLPVVSPRSGTCKHASSSSSSSKATPRSHRRVLERPTKYNPPSHPSRRLMPGHQALPLPPLTPEQEEEQRTKRYPGMRFHEGSFMYWFLTTRWIHVWITLSTLIVFSIYTFLNVFLKSSPYVDLLPHRNTFYTNPIQFLTGYFDVWKMTTEHDSTRIKEKQDKNLEDLTKRRRYAKVHGLDHEYWFYGWGLEKLRKGDQGQGVPLTKDEEEDVDRQIEEVRKASGRGRRRDQRREDAPEDRGLYLDWDGKRKPLKKWFGIF